ncbi:MAG: c-type cytochrome, partial [Planctomycetota bacterium]
PPPTGGGRGFLVVWGGWGGPPPPPPPGGEEAGPALPATPAAFVAAEALYDAKCSACHDTSREGAPRTGFLRAWSRRLDQGEEALAQHAIEGIGLMPPKGDNPELTDEEILSIVRYLVYRAKLDIPAG